MVHVIFFVNTAVHNRQTTATDFLWYNAVNFLKYSNFYFWSDVISTDCLSKYCNWFLRGVIVMIIELLWDYVIEPSSYHTCVSTYWLLNRFTSIIENICFTKLTNWTGILFSVLPCKRQCNNCFFNGTGNPPHGILNLHSSWHL